MAENDSMFSSVYDTATAENVAIKDNATRTAQAGRGMVGAYGSALAGGMFAKGLAKMAGMKTPEQKKAELITSILQGTSNLDRNDPNSYRKIAQEMMQKGLPGEAEKFMAQARKIETENRSYDLDVRKTVVDEEQLGINRAAQESSAEIAAGQLGLSKEQFERSKYEFDSTQSFEQSKFEYTQKQQDVLNQLSQDQLTIEQADSLLRRNEFQYQKSRDLVTDEQWKQQQEDMNWFRKAQVMMDWKRLSLDESTLENVKYVQKENWSREDQRFNYDKKQQEVTNALNDKKMSLEDAKQTLELNYFEWQKGRALTEDEQKKERFELDSKIAEVEIAHKEAQTAHQKLVNDAYPAMAKTRQAIDDFRVHSQHIFKDGDGQLMVVNKDSIGHPDGLSFHPATDADGNILSESKEADSYGLSVADKRLIDLVWKEYERIYYTGGSLYNDAKWSVPENLAARGLTEVPNFQEFALRSLENGGHGGHADVVESINRAYGEGGEGSYVAKKRAEQTLNRKPDQIVIQSDKGKSYLMNFDASNLGDKYNITSDVLAATAEFPGKANTDKDSNGQILAELEHLQRAHQPGSEDYNRYQMMITDFVSGLSTYEDPTNSRLDAGPDLGVGLSEEPTVDSEIVAQESTFTDKVGSGSFTQVTPPASAAGVNAWRKQSDKYYQAADGTWYKWVLDRNTVSRNKNQNK